MENFPKLLILIKNYCYKDIIFEQKYIHMSQNLQKLALQTQVIFWGHTVLSTVNALISARLD